MPKNIFDQIRAACEAVTQRARYVQLNRDHIPAYAASLPLEKIEKAKATKPDPHYHYYGPLEATVAYVLILDAINFGSAYFPYLHKPKAFSGHFDGYFVIAAALKNRFERQGSFTATELRDLTPPACAALFDQVLDGSPAEELMRHFTTALNELGQYLLDRFAGQFTNLVQAAETSAEKLVRILAGMQHFQDVAHYDDLKVPIYKRAQITAADLALVFAGQGPGTFSDLDQLTIFADNAVPHVLRTDGILHYDPVLAARIAAEEHLAPGSPEEVEIRASAIHAVELLVAELRHRQPDITPMRVDNLLWNTSHAPAYQTQPPHRTRTIFY